MLNSVVDNGSSRRFGIGFACTVTAVERLPDLLGELRGRALVAGKGGNIDVAWASLVEDDTTASAGRCSKFSLGALTAARSRNLSPTCFGARRLGAISDGRIGAESFWPGVEDPWL